MPDGASVHASACQSVNSRFDEHRLVQPYATPRLSNSPLEAEEVLAHYRGLWQVEEAFRVSKHDLRVRPIFHWTPARIQAHLAITFMALLCVRHLAYRVELQSRRLSPEAIRTALLHVQSSVLEHLGTGRRYVIPSSVSREAEKIYQVMGLKHSRVPFELV